MDPPLPPPPHSTGALHKEPSAALSISNFKKTWLPEGSIFVLSLGRENRWLGCYLFPHMLDLPPASQMTAESSFFLFFNGKQDVG